MDSKNVLAQFVSTDKKGAVFFLSAVKNDISFYLDGGINLLGIFKLDARICFCRGLISIDIQRYLLGLTMKLHVAVNYSNFTSGGFEFVFSLDTTELTKKLEYVKQRLENAARKVHEKFESAKREITCAQNRVNQLYGEIDYFNQKIRQCRNRISEASWWQTARFCFI